MSAQTRRITIIILGVLTVLLLGLAVFIALRLAQGTAPGDTSAAPTQSCTQSNAGSNACTNGNNDAWRCVCNGGNCGWVDIGETRECTVGQTACQSGNTGFRCRCVAYGCNELSYRCDEVDPACSGTTTSTTSTTNGQVCTPGSNRIVGTCGEGGCNSGQVPNDVCRSDGSGYDRQCPNVASCAGTTTSTTSTTSTTNGGTCAIDNPSTVNSYIQIPATCSTANTYTLQVFIQANPAGSTSQNCTAAGETPNQTLTVQPGQRFVPRDFNTSCGNCVQIDLFIGNGSGLGNSVGGTKEYMGDCASSTTSVSAPFCGDGVKSGSEQCDPTATPNGCAGGLNCASNCTCTSNPVCGSTCSTPGSQGTCPVGTTCTTLNGANSCTLNGCTGSTCTSNMCNPLCGGPCDPVAGPLCPNGHSCDPTSKTCILTSCQANPESCSTNRCAIIPDTAIFSDEADRLILGAMLIVIGIVAVRFQLIDKAYAQVTAGWTNTNAEVEPEQIQSKVSKKVSKERDQFEDEISRKL